MRLLLNAGTALAALLVPTMAHAQDADAQRQNETPTPTPSRADDPSNTVGIGEIVITAQRRAENLQDTPIAISAFGGEALQDRGIKDVAGLQSYVPNLHIGEEQGNSKISLRGIGLQGTSSLSDSGVAFYIDNFYISRPSGGSAQFYDVDRVEVLRGPQGTLYGRNATGGVVNVITKRPTNRVEGEVGLSYGSRNLVEARGFVNVPIADELAVRGTAVFFRDDGYVENTFPGQRDLFGSVGDLTLRGQLLYGAPDTLEVLLSGTYAKLNRSGIAQQFLERNVGGPPPTQALLRTIQPDDPDPLVTANNVSGYNRVETIRGTLQLTKDLGFAEAVLQLGKSREEPDLYQDFDGSPVDVSQFWKQEQNDAESAELRLASTGSGPFKWIVGGYYFSEETFIFRRVQLKGLTPGGVITLPDFLLDENGFSRTAAAFASGTYSLTPRVRATLGLRYTNDLKSGSKVTRGNFGAPFPPDIPNAAFPGRVSFDRITYRAGVEYDLAEDVLTYFNVSNGYKAGGFNITSNGAPYNPESITAYELGLKSDLFDRRMRINLDAFYYDYKDLQLTTLATINNAPGQFTTNAAKSKLYGFEIDTQFKPTRELLLSATYSYLNATFGEYFNLDPRDPNPVRDPADPSGLNRTNLSGNELPYARRHTINLGASYDYPFADGSSFLATINTNYHSRFFLREYNVPIDRVGAGTKSDITFNYNFPDDRVQLTAYVNNIEDRIEKNNIYISPGFIGLSATTAYTRPRTFGVRGTYRF